MSFDISPICPECSAQSFTLETSPDPRKPPRLVCDACEYTAYWRPGPDACDAGGETDE